MASKELDLGEVFLAEAEQRLDRLDTELLELESADPATAGPLIDSLFREAHTLKGASAVLGFAELTAVMHLVEDVFEGFRSGRTRPSTAVVDALLGTVDGLRTLIPAAVGGEDFVVAADALRAQLMATTTQPVEDGPPPVMLPTPRAATSPLAEPRPPADAVVIPPAPPTPAPPTPAPPVPVAGDAGRHPAAATLLVPVARVDEIVRLVGESAAAQLRLGRLIGERLHEDALQVAEFRDLGRVLHELQEAARRSRMVPVLTITGALHRAVRHAARALGKDVLWQIEGGTTELDRTVLEQLTDPLLHLIRNAVDHGIESPEERLLAGKPAQARVSLHAAQRGSEAILTITDDGRGIDVERVREQARQRGEDPTTLSDDECLYLIFRSGLSTSTAVTDLSGRGVGLDIVRMSLQRVRGRVEVRSTPGIGTEFRIQVPITLAVLPSLLVVASGQHYAIPMHDVVTVLAPGVPLIQAEGRQVVRVGDITVGVNDLATTLGLAAATAPEDRPRPVVVVSGLTRQHAFAVDGLLGQRDVVVKGLSPILPALPVYIGVSVEPDASILLVLDTRGLIDRVRLRERPALDTSASVRTAPVRQGNLLVVDDAMTVRELQRSILQRAGFTVRTASDGLEALAALAESPADLVLTDVEMPNMDGFTLTEAIRADESLANMAVLILTSLSSAADRERGLQAGADGYIVKADFDEAALLEAVDRLLGHPR